MVSAIKAGVDPNGYYAFYENVTLLGLSISMEKWDIVITILQNGGNINKDVRPGFGLSALDLLGETLRNTENKSGAAFYNCLLLGKYYGQSLPVLIDTPYIGGNTAPALVIAYTNWKFVKENSMPIVFAAAFTNNVDLLLALNLKGQGDKSYAYVGSEVLTSTPTKDSDTKILRFALFNNNPTTPRYWVLRWQKALEGRTEYSQETYKKIISKF